MIQRNLSNILLALLAVAVVLTAYNAFTNSDDENSASTRLANYLRVDRAKQAVVGAEDVVVGTDNTAESAATAETVTEAPATATTPAAPPAETPATPPAAAAPSQPTSTPATSSTDKSETVYTVKSGDTYGCIAEKYYGSYEHYLDVMRANPIYDLGFGEYSLHVDAKLILPAVTAASLKPATSLCK